MKKAALVIFCVAIEIAVIFFVALANLHPTAVRYCIFYNLLYGVACSCLVPLWLVRKENGTPASVGIKKVGMRQVAIVLAFAAFSVGGQLVPRIIQGQHIPWELLPVGIVPLVMTTFFEEFLFRGFVQGRVERQFGWPPAVIVSALMFALYHLGYPGFRSAGDIALLFAVGLLFAAAYKLSGNNLLVAYFVNLPNAFVTYMLKHGQFPAMTMRSTVAAAVTLALVVALLALSWGVRAKRAR